MRRATSSGILNNGRRIKIKRRSKFTNKPTGDNDSEGGRISAVEEIMFLMHEEHDDRFGPTVEERITVVFDDTINLADGDDMTWILDSGATIHATSRREFFTNYTTGDFGVVKMGNNDRAQITRRGDVHLETENGMTLVLKSVRHVEALRLNIILVGLLDKDQYKITKGNLIVAKGNMVLVCIMFMLNFLLFVSMHYRKKTHVLYGIRDLGT
jgi:hypothetical protein